MRCPNSECEHTIPDSVSFCAYCGTKVRHATHALTIQHETISDLRSLAECSQRHWDYVRRLLYDGTLATWLRTGLFQPANADRALEIVEQEKANQDLGLDRLLRELVPTFPPPQVTVQPPQLSGGDLPWQQQRALSFEVQNAGSGCLMGQVRSRATWLRVQPTEFSCVSGRSVPVQVTLSTAELNPGQQYRGELEVQGGTGGQVTVPVTVTVPAPRLEVTPTTLDLGAGYEGERLTQTLTLHNRGGSAFEAEIGSPARWLEARPASVRVEPGQSAAVKVAADTGGMPVGAHTAQVQVTARAGAWQAQAAVSVAVALPKLKTLQYRWGATLDYAAAGVVSMAVLLWILRQFPAGVGFWLGLAQAATWATLLGIGLGFYFAWRRKPAYRRYSGIGAIAVSSVAVIGLGVLWPQPVYRMSCYDQGLAFKEIGEWDLATATFALCGHYRDAIQQQAQAALVAQDWEAAVTAAEHLQAVDAVQKAQVLVEVYTLRTQAALAAQDWETAVTAAELLRAVDAVQGAQVLVEVYTLQARAALAAQDWETAVTAAEHLRTVDAAQGLALLTEAAQIAMTAEDWNAAMIAAKRLQSWDATRGAELWHTIQEARTLSAVTAEQPRPADGMVMVYVPAGEFQMGNEDGEIDERPVHTVVLDAFWIDQTEVTNAQYGRCVAADACAASEFANDARYNRATQPVVGVSWADAAAYATWVGGRLPTEAEWEYAARGPAGLEYPWGAQAPTCELANVSGCVGLTAPVGSYPAGASWVGVLDLTGNVWEWVADWSGDYPSDKQVNPTGPASGTLRVLRGGSFADDQNYARCATRYWCHPYSRLGYSGFRVVVSPLRP